MFVIECVQAKEREWVIYCVCARARVCVFACMRACAHLDCDAVEIACDGRGVVAMDGVERRKAALV